MPFPISAAEIAKTEAKTGFKFPSGLKSRFSRDNGGEIEVADDYWQLIPFADTSDRKRLTRTCNDIVRETTRMREWDGFPADAFVVAQNGSGDCLILLPAPDESNQLGEALYLWSHETRQYKLVAGSLETT